MVSLQSRDVAFKAVLGFVSGLMLSLFVLRGTSLAPGLSERAKFRDAAAKTDIFSLLVAIKFKNPQGLVAFHKLFGPYAEWVAANEPTTLSYQLLQHDSKPLEVLVLERYLVKDAYLNVHRKTPEFMMFKENFLRLKESPETSFEINGNSYNDTPNGFMY